MFFLSCLCIYALWSPAGKGLSSWLSFVMSNCEGVTFPIGILDPLYRFVIFVLFLTLLGSGNSRVCFSFESKLVIVVVGSLCMVAPIVSRGSVFRSCFIMQNIVSFIDLQPS